MEAIVSVLERAGRYLSLIRPMDVLDVAIIAYLVYKILCLVRSTRAENILKGVAIFLVALWLSSPAALNLRGVNYILSHMVEWGVLALIILFQPEIRQLLEKVGSRNIRLLRIFQPEQQSSELERAIDQTVAACTDMAKTRTGVLIVFERKLLLDEIARIRSEGVDREIFTLCKNEKYGQLIENLENVEDSASQMADFALSGQTVAQQITMLAGLTAEDADAALQHILSTDRMAVMDILPDGTAPLAENEEEAE